MESLPLLVLTIWCALLSYIDLRARRLPNALTLPGALVVLSYGFASGRGTTALYGALLLAIPYLLVHLRSPTALGAGDVKLALGLGAATSLGGAQVWVWAALTAPVLTALAGVGMLASETLRSQRVETTPSELVKAPPSRRVRVAPWWLTEVVRPHDSTRPELLRGTLARGSIRTIAHGPAMCAASVVALVAAR